MLNTAISIRFPMTRAYDKKLSEIKKEPKIKEVLEKARSLEMSPGEASKLLWDYLLPKGKELSVSDTLMRLSAHEDLTQGFYCSGGGMATPLSERYAEKHGLSGRFTPEGEARKMQNGAYR
jgi:hypothetical protein